MGRWPKSSHTSRDSRITQDPILALGLAIFLAGLINGTTGMGFAQLAAAGLALVMDVKSAVVLLSIMVPITAGMQLVQHRAQTSHFGRALPLLAAGLLGVPLGVALLAFLPSRVMAFVLGAFTIIFVVSSVRKTRLQARASQERVLSPLVGLTAGICNGSIGVSGPVVGSYLLALDMPAASFTFTVSLMYCSMSLLRLIGLSALGEVGQAQLAMGLGLLALALVGQRVGFWLQRRISQQSFERAVLGVMLVAGIGLIGRALAV